MTDWELTATTVFCEDIQQEVTIIVYRDGTVKCTGSQKYSRPGKTAAGELKEKSQKLRRTVACKGDACPELARRRDELMSRQ